jgi:aspartate/methionine/tyrosine aminotransferase
MGKFREFSGRGARFVTAEATKAGFSSTDSDWINLGQGQPELGSLPGAPDRIGQIDLDDSDYGYGPVDGLMELRIRVAEHYNRLYRNGMPSQLGPENVSIAAGGRVFMARVLGALDKTKLGLFSPDYMAFEDSGDVFSRVDVQVMRLSERDGFAVPFGQLHDDISSGKLGALMMSNPRNPTGNLVEGGELSELVGVANSVKCPLILDEYYSQYIWSGGTRPVSAAAHIEDVISSNIVIIDGITKNFRYPGLRLGWIVASAENIRKFSAVGSFLDGGPPVPTQKLAINLLEPGRADLETNAIFPVFLKKRDFMLRRLRELGVEVISEPQGTFYIYGSLRNMPQPISKGRDFFHEALKVKIATVPGEFFDLNPGGANLESSSLQSFMRFSFGPDLSALERGMDRLEKMIERI